MITEAGAADATLDAMRGAAAGLTVVVGVGMLVFAKRGWRARAALPPSGARHLRWVRAHFASVERRAELSLAVELALKCGKVCSALNYAAPSTMWRPQLCSDLNRGGKMLALTLVGASAR